MGHALAMWSDWHIPHVVYTDSLVGPSGETVALAALPLDDEAASSQAANHPANVAGVAAQLAMDAHPTPGDTRRRMDEEVGDLGGELWVPLRDIGCCPREPQAVTTDWLAVLAVTVAARPAVSAAAGAV
jgi:hypothetical protein